MAALTTGKLAPPFRLPLLTGGEFSLQDALRRGPVLLVFFKISCPVCQYAFPFLERVFRGNHAGGNVTVVGISQNAARDTQKFLREFGVTFPVALDDPANYAVSNAYGLTNVPTLFYITPNGEIEIASVGWSKADVEAINRKLAEHQHRQPHSLFKPGEKVHDFRAG